MTAASTIACPTNDVLNNRLQFILYGDGLVEVALLEQLLESPANDSIPIAFELVDDLA